VNPVLIVGGGISGICLGRHLSAREVPFQILDGSRLSGASRVAGGLINPVIGVRFSRAWRVDECLPEAVGFYRDLEKTWGKDFYREVPIRRLFKSPEQQKFWKEKRDLAGLQPYAHRTLSPEESFPGGKVHLGGVEITGGGWLNFPSLLMVAKKQWSARGCWMEGTLREGDVEFGGQTVRWRGQDFSAIVDCRGYLPESEWWPHLDWRPAKGEIITARTDEEWPQDVIWSRDVFVVPLGGGCYRVGATYSWDVSDAEVTTEGKNLLLKRLRTLTDSPVVVMDHRAGIRPILRDKRPVLGRHPQKPGLWICNGLGSRGEPWLPR
jgi:glycine oxidase